MQDFGSGDGGSNPPGGITARGYIRFCVLVSATSRFVWIPGNPGRRSENRLVHKPHPDL